MNFLASPIHLHLRNGPYEEIIPWPYLIRVGREDLFEVETSELGLEDGKKVIQKSVDRSEVRASAKAWDGEGLDVFSERAMARTW